MRLHLKMIMPQLNNLLSYLYATKGNNLKKANELIALALQKDPHNPHFLDTKALILYKENKFDQAIPMGTKSCSMHIQLIIQFYAIWENVITKTETLKKPVDNMKAAVQIGKK